MDLAAEKPTKKRKSDPEPTAMEILPQEIAMDILSRLPITSLLQFRFVNRGWNRLSRDPDLVELQFSQTARENPFLIFHCDNPLRNQLYFLALSGGQESAIAKKIQTPFWEAMPEFDVIASCNGLLCLSDSLYGDPLFVYNPFTRQHRELPKSRQFDDQEVVFGFGFHPVSNEYKVVKIIHYWNQYDAFPRRRRFRIPGLRRSEVQVFSLNGSRNWKSLGKVPYPLERRSSEALVNGRLHWLTQPLRRPGLRRSCGIVSFDIADEQFREVARPDCGGLNRTNYHLVVLGGCLAAVVCFHHYRFEIWVMKEYDVKESWVKEFNIKDGSPRFMKSQTRHPYGIWKHASGQRIARVVCMLENGNILIEYRGGVLVSHDPISGTSEKLAVQGLPDFFRSVVHVGCLKWIDSPLP
ncbi:F-box protein At3g07870 [Diospyros lotus]|uniref:F-box protein At3g07870 n=1 Tax=Diospyros lotus TaxID=55363 RepID=UPI00225B00AA|nr:F-box protein At3g07870 [Diospyros lotus]